MSWILGTIGTFTEVEKARISAYHPLPLSIVQTNSIYIAAGGIPATCLQGRFTPSQTTDWHAWIITGLGMQWEKDHSSFYTASKWNSILAAPQPEFSQIDGHFVALRFNDREVQIFTDQLGMRGFYAAKTAHGVVFSTRLDWVARASDNCEIDFESFGPQWLAFNQISCWSPVRQVYRLGPGSRARCTAISFEHKEILWSPDFDSNDEKGFEDVLKPFLIPRNVPSEAISFGLSGGLDSRVLLALYSSMGEKNLRLHVFGDSLDPDVIISTKIAHRLKFSHIHEQYIPQRSEELLARMREYLAQIYVTNPASAVINAGSVDQIAEHAALILDGSFGEIARRQSLNRLLIKGSKALRQRAADRMSRYMTIHRAAIFNRDIVETMERGFVRQTQWYLDETSSHPPVSDEDFVDLMTIRTRFPNYSGVEQARTDAFIMGYMPYLQPSVLKSMFHIPMHLKRKGRLFRRMIARHCPELASFPLVKGGTTYPYRFSTVPAHIWTLMKKKIGKPYTDMRMHAMLDMLKEYTQDLVHSQELQNYSAYDVQKIQFMVDRYYTGERHWAHEIDWWLSFEFWRQSLKKKN
ncbi:MAG: hypothetical protein ABR936_02615 [Bacteroidota bacterium]|jgi:hypothetical protein